MGPIDDLQLRYQALVAAAILSGGALGITIASGFAAFATGELATILPDLP